MYRIKRTYISTGSTEWFSRDNAGFFWELDPNSKYVTEYSSARQAGEDLRKAQQSGLLLYKYTIVHDERKATP